MNIFERLGRDIFMTETVKYGAAYMVADGYILDLYEEIKRQTSEDPVFVNGLFLTQRQPFAVAWAQTIWLFPEMMVIDSIKDGAKRLKNIQRNWVMHPPEVGSGLHGRAKLIQSNLPPVKQKQLHYPDPVPRSPLGHWMMLEAHGLLISPKVTNPFPLGVVSFAENKHIPPNRAYLKLWEAFTLCGISPKTSDVCVDFGASPGGWSWVLAQSGAQVLSIDKAPLSPKIAALPNVTWQQGSAFAVDPEELPPLDWVCSDIICYPERSYDLIQKWWVSGVCRNMICTIKFQRQEDQIWLDQIKQIPGGYCQHLYHNKHEVTWFGLRDKNTLPQFEPIRLT